ncbi:MAG: mercury(II) reductase [Candidatus Thermoplasmatota archaeon]|jgi:mercuric reductase|nr:mercury(II) reductase [Candidatus Thermoplasmatota archaeon]MCL5789377.1 mercury(II) reductase [Candidatus Thermoplasmatota archaeon]
MPEVQKFDLVILGRGAAAFSAAIKASELSNGEMTIAMVGTGPLGGTCVNFGCVPSKYLLEGSHSVFYPMNPKMQGVSKTSVGFDFTKIMEGLRSYVAKVRNSKYENVIGNYRNVKLLTGKGKFVDNKTISISDMDEREIALVSGSKVIIATGSRPKVPNIDGLTETGFLTSDTIWEINALPESVAIIGGGAIGLEIGQALLHFGSKVTVIESLNSLLPQTEHEIGYALKKHLEAEGMKFVMGARVNEVSKSGRMKKVEVTTNFGSETVEVHEIVVATGRRPNTEYLNLKAAGVDTDQNGLIKTSLKMQTSAQGIFAAGDCVSKKIFLETLAAREGVIAVESMFGEDVSIDYNSTAWAVFTSPQVAVVGMKEDEFSARNGSCSCRVFSLENLTKASIMGEKDGLIKMIVNPKNNKIVGMHIMAPNASDIITEGAYSIKNGYTIDDVISTSHIFPSISEGVKLAAQSFIRDISKMACCVE